MASPLVQALAFQNAVNPAQSGIAPTDVVGSYKLATDAAEKNYAAKIAERNAMWGGLAGMGGAGIMGFGPSIAKKYFGAGSTAASPTAPAAAAGGAGAADAPVGAALTDWTGEALPAGSSLASDMGLGGGASAALPTFGVDALGGAGGAGSVAADMGLGALAPAAGGTVAADLAGTGLGAAGAGVADMAAAGLPEWLASVLPFLALA